MKTRYYQVGGHRLSITFCNTQDDAALIQSFEPFRTEDSGATLYDVVVDDALVLPEREHEIGQFDCGGCNTGVYRQADGGYIFAISDISATLCATLHSDALFTRNQVVLHVDAPLQRRYGLNNAMMMAYAFATADRMTMLMHASVIRCEGKGFLMTAPSGTGKSTHTRLWYDNIPGCDLMNDDNPVVRVIDGQAIVYGSPWSGKTPCYRNIEAPIGGIVRLWQKPANSIRRLDPMDAFVNLLPAMSSMKWDKRVYTGVCNGVSALIRLCGMYGLGCLPDAEAAHLCHDTFLPSVRKGQERGSGVEQPER
ncbi:MAG: hypothetical protein HUK03_08225 [Bacteroidaceae bacterium]|nr:hypothetical protein [Bacteroidaceae bacterium]